jgi:hypothetical protein
MEESDLWRFWVVILDCGIEIYQTEQNASLDKPNSWLRLKQFCKDNDCKILSMAFARKDLNQTAQIDLRPQADGYFYSRRIRKMLTSNPYWAGHQEKAQGFGELKGDVLTIHWVDDDSGRVIVENRDIKTHHKNDGGIGLIRN